MSTVSVAPAYGETIQRIEGHCSVGVTLPAKTWYLPEGSTKWGFDCWTLIQNPNSKKATCRITYMSDGLTSPTFLKEVAANSRASFNMKNDIGEADASIKVQADIPIIPERSMYRNSKREGHNSIGATKPALDYYLAEGTTSWGYKTYVLVQNPNPKPTKVTITYMTKSGAKPQKPFTLAATSRKTIRVNDIVTNSDVSTKVHGSQPIISERAMYWDNGTGEACHDSIGVTAPSTTWYLAEGTTNGGFETWILIQNPGKAAANAQITFMTPAGSKQGPVIPLRPSSRQSVKVSDTVPLEWSVSTKVSSDRPVIAERSVYWNNRGGGHDSIGVTAPSTTWYLAEGSTNGGFETWILVQNPGSATATAQITYMTSTGPKAGPTITLLPGSRQSINIADAVPGEWNVSTKVTSDRPVVAERSMYWSKETAPPSPPQPPPPPPPSYIYDFKGEGKSVGENWKSPPIGLQQGITTFDYSINDDSTLGEILHLSLLDQAGNTVSHLANEYGNRSGSRCISVPTAGSYFLSIYADGKWSVHIEQPRPASAPPMPQSSFSGSSNKHTEFFTLDGRNYRFGVSYTGDGQFVVTIYKTTGESAVLVNKFGPVNGYPVLLEAPLGVYIIDVYCDDTPPYDWIMYGGPQ